MEPARLLSKIWNTGRFARKAIEGEFAKTVSKRDASTEIVSKLEFRYFL